MDIWIWLSSVCFAAYLIFRVLAHALGKIQTGRAIEAFIIGAKSSQVGQDLFWWHLEGRRYMVAAGYLMGVAYSANDDEARYSEFEDILEIAKEICTVDTITEKGRQLEAHPPSEIRARSCQKQPK